LERRSDGNRDANLPANLHDLLTLSKLAPHLASPSQEVPNLPNCPMHDGDGSLPRAQLEVGHSATADAEKYADVRPIWCDRVALNRKPLGLQDGPPLTEARPDLAPSVSQSTVTSGNTGKTGCGVAACDEPNPALTASSPGSARQTAAPEFPSQQTETRGLQVDRRGEPETTDPSGALAAVEFVHPFPTWSRAWLFPCPAGQITTSCGSVGRFGLAAARGFVPCAVDSRRAELDHPRGGGPAGCGAFEDASPVTEC
jgi:hypothetical protein